MVSWLHVDDWVGIARFLMESEDLSGPVNLVPPTRDQFRVHEKHASQLRPSWHRAARSLVRRSFGCRLLADGSRVGLKSRKVVSSVLAESGYRFKYTELAEALESLSE